MGDMPMRLFRKRNNWSTSGRWARLCVLCKGGGEKESSRTCSDLDLCRAPGTLLEPSKWEARVSVPPLTKNVKDGAPQGFQSLLPLKLRIGGTPADSKAPMRLTENVGREHTD
jgi:hypothetical protein